MLKDYIQRTSYLIIITGCFLALLAVAFGTTRARVYAQTVAFMNGFESNINDWSGNGNITRTSSGTNNISASSGDYYATVSGTPGPNTKFGGYNSKWPGNWTTSIDVYLDPSWEDGTGFIYTVATNDTEGVHLRDFMMNVGVLNDESTDNESKMVVLADTAGSPNSDPLYHIKAMPPERRAEITTAGWYTIQHSFTDVEGELIVTISLLDSDSNVVYSQAIDYEWMNDQIPETVGGNRYGWFTHITVPSGLAIDNVTRSIAEATGNTVHIDNAEDGAPVYILSPDSVVLTDSSAMLADMSHEKDGYMYPLGLIGFKYNTSNSSDTITLTFITELPVDDVIARKYNPDTQVYTTIEDAIITAVDYEGRAAIQVSYVIVDNGPLDLNPAVGAVEDPVGIALVDDLAGASGGVEAPNTGLVRERTMFFIGAFGVGSVLLIRSVWNWKATKNY